MNLFYDSISIVRRDQRDMKRVLEVSGTADLLIEVHSVFVSGVSVQAVIGESLPL